MLKELMAKLRGAKSAAQWAEAIAELQGSVESTGRNLTLLRAALKSAPFEKTEDEVAALRQRVRDNEDELHFLEGALEEAHRRHGEAVEAEKRSAIEAMMSEAEANWAELGRVWSDFDKHIAAAIRAAQRAADLGQSIKAANAKAVSADFGNLELRLPATNPARLVEVLRDINTTSGGEAMAKWKADGRMRKGDR